MSQLQPQRPIRWPLIATVWVVCIATLVLMYLVLGSLGG